MPNLPIDRFTPLWSYYDWAITGANCVVYLSSTEATVKRQLENVPTIGVGYEIQQSKVPLYGYNDVGPRMIMRGQRLVSGQLIIAHREVGYLQKVLREADPVLYNTTDTLDLKESLRLKYWNTRSWESNFKDPQRKNFTNEDDMYNIFYAHPNFDISIVYGTGDEIKSISTGGKINLQEILGKESEWYNGSDNEYNDVNPLYRPKNANLDLTKQRETISSVQLTGLSKSVAADGEIIVEAYSFLAVDVLYQ
jgi:hypothetical protein